MTDTPKGRDFLAANCPMPQLDFDAITLGHGGGGLLTNALLDAGVFELFRDPRLAERHDGAVLDLSGPTAFTTDSFVVSPIFFPGGTIGELSVNGTVNDLAMCGARPQYLSLSFILEEGLSMERFWTVLCAVRAAAEAAGVAVVTGDTKVVERGKGDQIFINTSGLGAVHPKASIHSGRVAVGDRVLLSGDIARHGMAIMSVREGLAFESPIESDTAALHEPVLALLDELGDAVHLLRDATRGGVATVLNEIAGQRQVGVDLRERDIPVSEPVAGACEMLGLDPLYVANEGRFVAVVARDAADAALAILKRFPVCTEAAMVGEVVPAHPRQVVLTSGIGGRRVVSMLPGEQLPRIC